MNISAEEIAAFQSLVLDFYREQGRDFPWRRTRDPYAIMVSEFMLQQTQTERVAGRYGPWLERFPTTESLASASLAEVLAEWSGLGYNRRARFLKEAARIIAEDRGGVFPVEPEELDALPGIGPYTARAIVCFAFDRRECFIETNIRSVYIHHFSRFFANRAAVKDAEILSLIENTLPDSSPRIFYYALMDYGAALKKSQPNPGRKSAHYTRQSRFEGSLRQARGAILRALSRPAMQVMPATPSMLSLEEIAAGEGTDLERLQRAATALENEGLITGESGRYRIRG